MFQILRDFFQGPASARGETGESTVSVELATAVLLVEAMRADQGAAPEERAAIGHALQERFALSPDQVQQLLALAEERSRVANDFFAFTHALNQRLTHPEKIHVIEQMWQVAWVDGSADPGESHVISRVVSSEADCTPRMQKNLSAFCHGTGAASC